MIKTPSKEILDGVDILKNEIYLCHVQIIIALSLESSQNYIDVILDVVIAETYIFILRS